MPQPITQIPIPPLMQDLPRDDRGYPIPTIVLRDPTGKPIFTANNQTVVDHCDQHKLCGICGNPLHNDIWVLGGPLSAFHPNGAYIDTPIHHDCATYALQTCPYLSLPDYHSITGRETKLQQQYPQHQFQNPTQRPARLPIIVLAKTTGYTRTPATQSIRYVRPNRPFLAIEFWKHGKQLTQEQAQEILAKQE